MKSYEQMDRGYIRHLAARGASLNETLEQTEIRIKALIPKLTPYLLGELRRGYYQGLCNNIMSDIQNIIRYGNRDELKTLQVRLLELRREFYEEDEP